jgi:hypothetical protein
MLLRAMSIVLLVGCSFDHGTATATGDDAGTSGDPDAPVTGSGSDAAMNNGSDASWCWSVAGVSVNVCVGTQPTGTITVSSNTSIDTGSTGTGPLQCKALVAGSTNVCVIAASSIDINNNATLSAHGARPLVLIASTIRIDGTLDVASHVNGQSGPGANMSGCSPGNPSPNNRGGGGQGGSFGGTGGDGGDQDGQPMSHGRAGMALMPTTLRGGCPGANGGDGGGARGDGGGAVLLIADSIQLGSNSAINASGASGRGAPQGRKGGGGAGSGGMIALSATTIAVGANTAIWANGGAGGSGSSNPTAGQSGTDSTSPLSGGTGGTAPGNAGNGGVGYPAVQRDGASGSGGSDGGGGGGGGAGIIRNFTSSSLGSAVSPPAS